MENGLYKNDNGSLLYAEIAIYYPDGTIIYVKDYENSDKEYNGWRWFSTREEAYSFFGVEIPDELKK
jgi:hypothetical protein